MVICGPSGIGKTSWALANAPAPFLLVSDQDDLKGFDVHRHKSIVFDELRCNGTIVDGRVKGQWPLQSQIKLCTYDTPVTIRCRFINGHIPARVPKIFTCTGSFLFTKDDQIKRRVTLINLYTDRATEDLWDNF